MVALNQIVNANEIPERDDYAPIQPGTYTGMIVNSEMKPTKNGQMIVLEIDVTDGEAQGRKLFERLNIDNPSEKAVEIAYKTLGEIIRACGKVTIKDTNELHNKRFTMDVVLDPAKPYIKDGVEYPGNPQNRIKKYSVLGSAATGNAAAPGTGTPAATTGATAASGAAPWKR